MCVYDIATCMYLLHGLSVIYKYLKRGFKDFLRKVPENSEREIHRGYLIFSV